MDILIQVIVRTIASFFVLLILVRLIGKQQIAQLTYFDYIVGITIGSIAATLSVQVNEFSIPTFVGMVLWAVLAILVAIIEMKSVKLRNLMQGKATIVIYKGRVCYDNIKSLRLTMDDLLSELRANNVFNFSDVEFALFEPSGKLSILKKSQKQTVTREDMNINSEYENLPYEIIIDGELLYDNLKRMNISKAWVYHQLSKINIYDTGEISLAQVDTKGNLYVDMKYRDEYHIINK